MRWAFDAVVGRLFSQPGAADAVSIPQDVPHRDFRTPEYAGFDTIQSTFWQQDRGIGGSFGYNREETEADYTTSSELIGSLAKAAANNGALLLNVGPSGGEGDIVQAQLRRSSKSEPGWRSTVRRWMAAGRGPARRGARRGRPGCLHAKGRYGVRRRPRPAEG